MRTMQVTPVVKWKGTDPKGLLEQRKYYRRLSNNPKMGLSMQPRKIERKITEAGGGDEQLEVRSAPVPIIL